MNLRAVQAIYLFEMSRTARTLLQSIVSPVISTSLYFVVFGAAIGSRITEIEGVSYGAFIVPGLIMMMLLTQSVANASFGIYFPKFTGTIYELLSAPVSAFEIVLGYVGAAATKSIVLGLIILATAGLFVPLRLDHPVWMLARFHHRCLGGRVRKAPGGATPRHHPAELPWRQLLLHQGAAAGLADDRSHQSGGLFDQRLPLELLRHRRCRRERQPRHDDDIPHRLPRGGVVDFQDGLSAQAIGCPEPGT